MTRTMLLVGTSKGAFILDGDSNRSSWSLRGPLCEGWPIHDLQWDPSTGSIYAGGGSIWYGPAVFRSDDLGKTWSHSSEGITYGDDGPKIPTVWNVTPAHGSIYAGVEPAGLFRSEDGGANWSHVGGLREHPSRPDWQPGAGGLICHTIVPHPSEAEKMWVAISAVGTFATEDGGATWEARNRGVVNCNSPDPHPETGQCVHKLVMAAGQPDRFYQQNHCGVYRSTDGGKQWQDISAGLVSEFGFVFGAHPRDPATGWVIPLSHPEEGRYAPGGSLGVWRTTDSGDSWQRHGEGLPQENAYVGVYREAMAVDRLDPVGVFFGTSTGQLYGSVDEGGTWSVVAENLPPIWGVEAVAVE
ncbi:MAG TPA: exo-alpha-sialidase [Candidatus Dormibacteraeota bacterium]|nr:exo-alpha-sialidase [Candidatus Dormibacteraeota bacterium]